MDKLTPPLSLRNLYIISCLLTGLVLTGCSDDEDDIPLQQVEETRTLTEQELKALQEQTKSGNSPANDAQSPVIYFGFDLRASPQEDAAQYLPFLDYLQAATGYTYKLHFTPKNSSTVDQLGNGVIQLAAMGATSYLEARQKYHAVSLVRGLNHQNKAEYQSVFVVKPGSKIREISDFKNKRVAFGSKDSTQGHLIPRIILKKHGIELTDLKSYSYTGSHQSCAEAVVSGKFDICGMQDQLAHKLAKQGLIKIIYISAYYPSSGIVASADLDTKARDKITRALLDFDPIHKHSKKLFHWENTEMPRGFIAAKEQDYNDLREWSVKLGFLAEE